MDVGDRVDKRNLMTIDGTGVAVPSLDAIVHLQFRRFAHCPICNLHMRDVMRRHQEIADAGIREVVVFDSAADELRRYQADLPFAVVADPDRKLYKEFGVESSIRSILHPRAWRAGAKGMRWTTASGALGLGEGHLGKPADFLIGVDGTVRACKYGEHADDQWSVDEMLALATR
ncbi:peroxiredoxin-like family protein [Mycobacterium sp.]|uniref:peroxiredoxin-like family protein n=1 Tax=Mycobacterium sp. TaxID=1785 RepID=UPI0039C8E5B9